jgi:hypothetical protein
MAIRSPNRSVRRQPFFKDFGGRLTSMHCFAH